MPKGDKPPTSVDKFRTEELRHFLKRIHGRRKTNTLRPLTTPLGDDKSFQPGERYSQVRAPFVISDRMNLVDDHRADALEHLAALLGGEQDEQGLRRISGFPLKRAALRRL